MKTMIKILTLATILSGFLSAENMEFSGAEPKTAHNGIAHALGIGGTVFDTWGFTYRHHFANNFGIAASIGGSFRNSWGHAGTGIGLLYTLAHHRFSVQSLPNSSIRIYVALYTGITYEGNQKVSNVKVDSFVTTTKHMIKVGMGPGPGVEYFFTKNLAVHIELPWMTTISIEPDPAGVFFASSFPNFGGGLSYYF